MKTFIQSLLLVVAGNLAATAMAVTISLVPFNAATSGVDISADISTDGTYAYFAFSNNSTGAGSGAAVARIYFESGLGSLGLSAGTITAQSGTDFSTSYGGPGSPPSGNNMPNNSWVGNLTAYGASSPAPTSGMGVGDSITFRFNYTGSESALVDALTDMDGNSRIAAHILNCAGGNSCVGSSVTRLPVPVPAALPLFLGALGGLGFLSRRSRKIT